MAKVDLFPDFKEFLKSLNSANVRYLVLGGYSVIHYGYKRSTADLDVWIAIEPENLEKVSIVLQNYGGFDASAVAPAKLNDPGKVFKFGREPVRIDILTGPSGVDFELSYSRRNEVIWDGVKVSLISFEDLRSNKKASGRAKDQADLDHLPAILPTNAVGNARRRRRGRKS